MNNKEEYGDFQTPLQLAKDVCILLANEGVAPATIIEPTCGQGNFIFAALQTFDNLSKVVGLEYNSVYVEELKTKLLKHPQTALAEITQGDFFQQEWGKSLRELATPILLLGNPPWVTNSALGKFNGTNLPRKSNFYGRNGFDALTGKSNFDISEWMLIHLLEWGRTSDITLAFLCKTAVARKVILHRWKHHDDYQFTLYEFDAFKWFGVSVATCLFVARNSTDREHQACRVYKGISDPTLIGTLDIADGALITDIEKFAGLRFLVGESAYKWRSGVKHDCAKVMELSTENNHYKNKLGECIELENSYLYHLLKSSDIAKGNVKPRKHIVITQRSIGEETATIAQKAPKTWRYLNAHADLLHKRGSSIYRNRPPFSIFGIGAYSFAPWKLTISAFYKSLNFVVVEPVDGKPVMLDDTCYFLPCESKEEALLLQRLLMDDYAQAFYRSYIFWGNKRPVTIDILKKLDLHKLANQIGLGADYARFVRSNPYITRHRPQLSLFDAI